MGLAEKKAVKQAQDETLPTLKKSISDLTGADVAIEVDWASFENSPIAFGDIARDGEFKRILTTYMVTPLESGIKEVAKDAMGKEALQGGLKKIVVKNLAGPGRKVSFASGTVTLEEKFNGGEYFNSTKVKQAIEAGL